MKISYRVLASGVLLAASLTAGCEGGGPGGGGIPITISATWTDINDDTHTVTFRSPDDGQTAGVLSGTEEGGNCVNRCPVGGFWRNGRIEITIDRGNDVRPKFSSEFYEDNPTQLTFVQIGGSESFTLGQ